MSRGVLDYEKDLHYFIRNSVYSCFYGLYCNYDIIRYGTKRIQEGLN